MEVQVITREQQLNAIVYLFFAVLLEEPLLKIKYNTRQKNNLHLKVSS
jgi:hypothetical protein